MADDRTLIDRRTFLKGVGAATVAGGLAGPMAGVERALARPAPPVVITHGVVTGDVTSSGALLWSRASAAALMQVELGRGDGPGAGAGPRRRLARHVDAAHDFVGRFAVDGLEPETDYWYRVIARRRGSAADSPVARFRTAPADHRPAPVRFTWGGDVGQGMRNRPPFPAFAAMAAESPAFFVFNGDTIYGDSTTPVGPAATTVPGFWAKYKENREDPSLQALAAGTPLVVNWDDHEVDNDYRGLDPDLPAGRLSVGRQAFFDYWPVATSPAVTYRSMRWGRELEVFVLDNRQFADPLDKPDGPGKTMLGPAQLAWLREGVRQSDATWKVLVTSCPLSILRSAAPPQDDWVSYEHELGELLRAWQQAGVTNLVWLTADVHWAQAIEYPRFGMWEFVGCPIGANPRVAGMPLSPTFGPVERFLGLGARSYGSVAVDPVEGTMAVDLKLESGALRHRSVLRAAQR